MINNLRLPIRVTIQPEKGREHMSPTGSEKRTAPSAASESRKVCWIVAIRDAQLAKHNPAIKNIALTATRSALLDSGLITSESFIFTTKCKKYTKMIKYKYNCLRLTVSFKLFQIFMLN